MLTITSLCYNQKDAPSHSSHQSTQSSPNNAKMSICFLSKSDLLLNCVKGGSKKIKTNFDNLAVLISRAERVVKLL